MCRPLQTVNYLLDPVNYNGYIVVNHPFTNNTAPRTRGGTCFTGGNNNPGFITYDSNLVLGTTTPYTTNSNFVVCNNLENTDTVWHINYNSQLYERLLDPFEIYSYHNTSKPETFSAKNQLMNLIPDIYYKETYPYETTKIYSTSGVDAEIKLSGLPDDNVYTMLNTNSTLYNAYPNTQFWVLD
jgi:hypothetical protein